MCGIAGVFSARSDGPDAMHAIADRMSSRLAHRGPDDSGVWTSPRVGLGFRRLSIIDLSETGRQPMSSASGRYVIIFNGEIYNYRDLRLSLESHGERFRGTSDTEVLLAAVERWGLEDAIGRCVGMFGIALWDTERGCLHLVRDRLGIKPVFVATAPGEVYFGSELKAILAAPAVSREIDADGLFSYFRYLYVPGPKSIYANVRKLPPGHILTIESPEAPLPESRPYWSLVEAARAGLANPFAGSDEDAIEATEEVLERAVAERLYADVPLGALLSGGIDSSLTVALMRTHSDAVRTYSVSFTDEDFDEADHAAEVARHLGTHHTEVTLSPEEAWGVVPDLAGMFDEPFANPAAIPTYLVCGVARRDVTVALAGNGGDEVFAGYNRYLTGERALELARRLPAPVRRLASAGVRAVPYSAWSRWRSAPGGVRLPGRRVYKLGRLLNQDTAGDRYRSLVSAWDAPDAVMRRGGESAGPLDLALGHLGPEADLLSGMLLADQLTYLVDDQLAMVDRMSSAVSLEVRVPLLDHRLVELSWRMPSGLKRRDGEGKWLLRRVLERHVPRALFERPKMGLSVPIAEWLAGPLEGWASDTVSDLRNHPDEHVDGDAIHDAWTRFRGGDGELELSMWAALMYGSWRAHAAS